MEIKEVADAVKKIEMILNNLRKSEKDLSRAKLSKREKVKPQLRIVRRKIDEFKQELDRLNNLNL